MFTRVPNRQTLHISSLATRVPPTGSIDWHFMSVDAAGCLHNMNTCSMMFCSAGSADTVAQSCFHTIPPWKQLFYRTSTFSQNSRHSPMLRNFISSYLYLTTFLSITALYLCLFIAEWINCTLFRLLPFEHPSFSSSLGLLFCHYKLLSVSHSVYLNRFFFHPRFLRLCFPIDSVRRFEHFARFAHSYFILLSISNTCVLKINQTCASIDLQHVKWQSLQPTVLVNTSRLQDPL